MKQLTLQGKWLAAASALLILSAGCSAQTPGQEPSPAASTSSNDEQVVSATGVVVPAEWATISFPVPGQVVELTAEEGALVEEGDIIARLDTTDFDIALAQAEAALAVAEANLALATAGPRDAEIERAEDQLAAANARVAVAVAQRDQLLAAPDAAVVIQAQTEVDQAAQSQQNAQEGYDRLMSYIPHWDDFNFEPGDRTPLDGEQNARYALQLANLRLAAAQARLDDLLDGPNPQDLQVAEARIWVAAAQRDAAKAYLDLVMAGPHPADIAITDAEVSQARARVESAEAAREQGMLRAPFTGTISELRVDVGEWIGGGQPVGVIADLTHLRIETTDLNELDVARVREGSEATITFDALSDEVQGTVHRIAPKSSEGAGVNYTVVIDLQEIPAGLRWGMTAFVDIEAD